MAGRAPVSYAHYAERSGRPPVDLTYYDVLYRFKFAVPTRASMSVRCSTETRSTATDLHEFAGGLIEARSRGSRSFPL